jgi:hypothetical protein
MGEVSLARADAPSGGQGFVQTHVRAWGARRKRIENGDLDALTFGDHWIGHQLAVAQVR